VTDNIVFTSNSGHSISLAGTGGWERKTHVEMVWGTGVTFDVRAETFDDDFQSALDGTIAFLHQVDEWFSTYKAYTPISLLRNGVLAESLTPPVVQEVLNACRTAKAISGGVFDPWAVRGGVDPSGYVKGWAAGVAAELIVSAGYPNVCVNAGGDIMTRGYQAPGEPWAIGLTNPYDTTEIIEVVNVSEQAVATSGLYERGEHITDPTTGTHSTYFDSATIIGTDPGLADALATAALIKGPDCIGWFTNLPDWSVYFIKDGQAMFYGPAFPSSLAG
jgi:FAD:protein FMN transferase